MLKKAKFKSITPHFKAQNSALVYQDAFVFPSIHDGESKVQFSTAGVAWADLVITFLFRLPKVIII